MAERNFRDKITMKFSVSQLDRIILALINNGYNKKFASNVSRLFNLFNMSMISNEYEKEVRVYLIKEITDIINKNNIEEKDSILAFLDPDGKHYDKAVEILNSLYDLEITDAELTKLDSSITENLRYGAIMERTDKFEDMLLQIKTGNYESLDDAVNQFGEEVTSLSRDIASSRESLEDAKKDLSLSSSGFVNVLSNIITKERNPEMKVKTGIQALNIMLNGGFEKGRLYCVLGKAKSWKS